MKDQHGSKLEITYFPFFFVAEIASGLDVRSALLLDPRTTETCL